MGLIRKNHFRKYTIKGMNTFYNKAILKTGKYLNFSLKKG